VISLSDVALARHEVLGLIGEQKANIAGSAA
jgi:hypothetical protein